MSKTIKSTPSNVSTLPMESPSFADVLHKAQSHKGRVEAMHRAGVIKRSTVNGLTVADEGKRTPEDKAAYKIVDHFAFMASLAGVSPAEYAATMDAAFAARANANALASKAA